MSRRFWTADEDALVRDRYPHEPTAAIARALGRSAASINSRAMAVGLHKTAAYLATPAACRLRQGGNIGAATRFQKGQVSLNKGLRRPGWFRGRMRETQFVAGVPSWRSMPIGATRLIDGYIYRKVSAVPHQPYSVNWKPEHRLVWTAAHGPIPSGYAIRFKDGNSQHCALENLELVHRRDVMAANSIHNLPEALASTIRLLGALNRQIRRKSEHHENSDQKQDRRSA